MTIASGLASRKSAKSTIGAQDQHTTANHSQTTLFVQARDLPVTSDPKIAKAVGSAKSIRLGNSDKLARKALPEVEAVRVGLQLGVGH